MISGTLDNGDSADGFDSGSRQGLIVQASSSEELLHIAVAAWRRLCRRVRRDRGQRARFRHPGLDRRRQYQPGGRQRGRLAAEQGVYVNATNEARATTFA
ncbi:hypothetical protein LP420_40245 [Massilia sp. B-10]|nr:hypothetical protein LP420_40245 [Massilia sp. B-10]